MKKGEIEKEEEQKQEVCVCACVCVCECLCVVIKPITNKKTHEFTVVFQVHFEDSVKALHDRNQCKKCVQKKEE